MGNTGRARSSRRRRSVRTRRGLMIITVAVCALFIVLSVQGIRMRAQIVENDITRQQIVSALEEEEERRRASDEARAYISSEEFIRNTARSRLGLVDKDEIIFKPAP